MHKLFLLLIPHWVGLVFAAWWILSAAVEGMPAPCVQSSFAYRWAYVSCHVFAANIRRALRARFPGDPLAPGCEVDHGVDADGARPSQPLALPRPADSGEPAE